MGTQTDSTISFLIASEASFMVLDHFDKQNQIYKIHFATLFTNWFRIPQKTFSRILSRSEHSTQRVPIEYVCYSHQSLIYANTNPTNAICGP